MSRTLSSKQLKVLLNGFEDQGCEVKGSKGGYKILCPSGGIFALHLTLSDFRGMMNLRSVARNAGLSWPLDAKAR